MTYRYYVYIVSNFERSVFYIGVTNDLEFRLEQHWLGIGGAFTKKYKCHYLMYFEEFDDVGKAIEREKNLKNWHRDWKVNLIKQHNPDLLDLSA